ncbi:MAG: SsrA-binding protein SmpB [Candidatus Omnitrophica bacterium]|nr:SsrA-binding protein SmpB [Candidatus Omnitrophota bacterium]MCM8801947.1 SsrA-binding protein SmpB [Candidatus Omnitrophota bacterium]
MKIENKSAYHNYEILEKIEAGIVLKGSEVKSIREGKISFKDSYAKVENGEVFLHNFYIAPYQSSFEKINPLRKKKILLHKNEIRRIEKKISEKHLTLIPLSVYFNNRGLAKIELAIAKGKKLFDKRKELKEREIKREIERKMKNMGAK